MGPGFRPGPLSFAVLYTSCPQLMQRGPWFLQIAPQLMYLVNQRFTLAMQDRADIFEEDFDVA
jgi:hypothetical protein